MLTSLRPSRFQKNPKDAVAGEGERLPGGKNIDLWHTDSYFLEIQGIFARKPQAPALLFQSAPSPVQLEIDQRTAPGLLKKNLLSSLLKLFWSILTSTPRFFWSTLCKEVNMTRKLLFRVVLPTGRPSRAIPEPVSDKISRLLRPWLAEAKRAQQPLALPFPAAAGFQARVEERSDGLVAHLVRPFEDASQPPRRLATIGVAARADGLESLWRHVLTITRTLSPMPSGAPCCMVVPDREHAADFPEIHEWLEEFADGIARAWLDDNDDGPANPAHAVGRASSRMAA